MTFEKILLHKKYPLIFGVPSIKSSIYALFFSILIGFTSVLTYFIFELGINVPFFNILSMLLFAHFILVLITSSANLLYIFRYFLVWVLIFSTSSIFSIYDGRVLVSWHGAEYQTPENTVKLVLAGMLSLTGSLIGWHLSLINNKSIRYVPTIINNRKRSKFRNFGFILAFGFGLLYLWKAGGLVGNGYAYGDRVEGFSLKFGVFNVFHFFGISLLIISIISEKFKNNKILIFAALSLFLGLMAGSRADFLPQIFLLLAFIANPIFFKILNSSKPISRMFPYIVGALLSIIFLYYFASFIALYRTGVYGIFDVVTIIAQSEGVSFIREIDGVSVIFLETGNMILGGLYSAIIQANHDYTGFLYGKSYLNYFLNTPPGFLGFPRPLGLEWFTDIDGTVMSQGGIFEVAEAYWNFGFIGCFFVSFVLSYFFAWLLRRGVSRSNYFFISFYLVFGLIGFRAVWYQNFAYYRLMTVMVCIFLISIFLARWFVLDRRLKFHEN